jgi:hypothetical protein
MRVDARRNYDKLIEAARVAFSEHGSATGSVALTAGSSLGMLPRHAADSAS